MTESVLWLCPACYRGDHANHEREWGPGKVCPCPGCFRRPQDAPGEPDPPEPYLEHAYMSTACQHAIHERCPKYCGFCAASCLCTCHRPPLSPDIR